MGYCGYSLYFFLFIRYLLACDLPIRTLHAKQFLYPLPSASRASLTLPHLPHNPAWIQALRFSLIAANSFSLQDLQR